MKYIPRLPKKNVNVSPTSPVKEFVILAGGLLGFCVVIYFLLGLSVDLILPRISMKLETKMARLFIRSVSEKSGSMDTERTVQAMMDRLQHQCATLPYELKVHIRRSPMINALALPGGHIFVFTGLLDKVTSENELAFVLAHEMGHYANRDHLRGIGRALVFISVSSLVLGPDSGVSRLMANALKITELRFSREQETRADAFALKALNCSYGHVQGASDFFSKIKKEEEPGKFGHYFSSHPNNRQRISRIEASIKTNGFSQREYIPLPETLKK